MRISDWSSDVCSSDLRRRHASSGGILRGNYRMGHGAYTIGSHPLFMAGRVAYRMLEQPYLIGGLALAAGYVRAWIERAPRLAAPALVRQLRREPLGRLPRMNRLRQYQENGKRAGRERGG